MIPYSTQSVSEADIRAVAKTLRSPYLTQGPAILSFEKAIAKKSGQNTRSLSRRARGPARRLCGRGLKGRGRGHRACTHLCRDGERRALRRRAPPYSPMSRSRTAPCPSPMRRKNNRKDEGHHTSRLCGTARRPRRMSSAREEAQPPFNRRRRTEPRRVVQGSTARHAGGHDHVQLPSGEIHHDGEGGVIVTDNPAYDAALRIFRHHGISKDPETFARKNEGAWYQEMQMLGYNYRITDMQAALGESQLKRLDSFIARRRAAAKRYEKLLASIPNLILPPSDDAKRRSAWHLYAVRLAPKIAHRRDAVLARLHKEGIGAQVHYLPVYLHVYYERLGYKKGLCPNAETFAASEIPSRSFRTLRTNSRCSLRGRCAPRSRTSHEPR